MKNAEIELVSKRTWDRLRRSSYERIESEWQGRRGFQMILPMRIGAVIRLCCTDLSLAKPDKAVLFEIIEHLRSRGNVAVVKGGSSTPTVFVASSYGDEVLVQNETGYRSKKDAPIEMPPERPVTKRDLWAEFTDKPLSKQQAEALIVLYQHNGTISDPSGFIVGNFGIHSSDVVRGLEGRGLVKIKNKNERRFSKIELTSAGKWAVSNLSYLQGAPIRLATFLVRRGGFFRGSTPVATTSEIATETHMSITLIERAISRLIEEKLLVREWSQGGGCTASIRWIGDKVPGVHLVPLEAPESPQEAVEEPEDVEVPEQAPETPAEQPEPPRAGPHHLLQEYAVLRARIKAEMEESAGVTEIRRILRRFNEGECSSIQALAMIEDAVE